MPNSFGYNFIETALIKAYAAYTELHEKTSLRADRSAFSILTIGTTITNYVVLLPSNSNLEVVAKVEGIKRSTCLAVKKVEI